MGQSRCGVTEVPIRRMYYSGRSDSDIHLLRHQNSQSRDLRVDLQFVEVLPDGSDNDQSAEDYLNAHTGPTEDVRLEFRPTFAAPRSSATSGPISASGSIVSAAK